MENFFVSHGWIKKFKKYARFATREDSWENMSVNEGTVELWKEDLAALIN